MKVTLEPELSSLYFCFWDCIARRQVNAGNGVQQIDVQTKQTVLAQFDLYLDDEKKNAAAKKVGSLDFQFGESAVAGVSAVIPWTDARPASRFVNKDFCKICSDASKSGGKDSGGGLAAWSRLDQLTLSIPRDKSKQFAVASFGLYSDDSCTRQLPRAGYSVLFCGDDHLKTQLPAGVEGSIETIREDNGIFQLSDFFGGTSVKPAVIGAVTAVCAELKSDIKEWADVDNDLLIQKFTELVDTFTG